MKVKKKSKKPISGIFLLITFLVFVLLFTYSSLNLKNIDFGYRMQDLMAQEKKLKEEIDRLKARRASLLNLDRVERIVMRELGYQYPEPHQFIKVFENQDDQNENQ
jgi:cell division protein FtsL